MFIEICVVLQCLAQFDRFLKRDFFTCVTPVGTIVP